MLLIFKSFEVFTILKRLEILSKGLSPTTTTKTNCIFLVECSDMKVLVLGLKQNTIVKTRVGTGLACKFQLAFRFSANSFHALFEYPEKFVVYRHFENIENSRTQQISIAKKQQKNKNQQKVITFLRTCVCS